MKKLTAILMVQFILVGMDLATAQTIISPKELEKISDYSALAFEQYALKNGFSPQSSLSTNTTTLYLSDKSRGNGRFDQLSRTFINGMYSPIVQFATTDKQYYLDAFNYATANNYKATKQEQQEILEGTVTTWYYFSNDNYTIIFYTLTGADNIPFYNLQVFKNYGK